MIKKMMNGTSSKRKLV